MSQRQVDLSEFEASQDYTAIPCLKLTMRGKKEGREFYEVPDPALLPSKLGALIDKMIHVEV